MTLLNDYSADQSGVELVLHPSLSCFAATSFNHVPEQMNRYSIAFILMQILSE